MKKRGKNELNKNKRFPPKRIPQNTLKKLEKIGNGGGWRKGLAKCLTIYEMVERDPAIILQKELEHFSGLIKSFANDNHYEHFIDSNLPAVIHKFIKTGRIDHTMINSRVEKTIDKFNVDNKKDSDKQ